MVKMVKQPLFIVPTAVSLDSVGWILAFMLSAVFVDAQTRKFSSVIHPLYRRRPEI